MNTTLILLTIKAIFMSLIKTQMISNIKDYIIIVRRENSIQNLKVSFYRCILLNDTKRLLNV